MKRCALLLQQILWLVGQLSVSVGVLLDAVVFVWGGSTGKGKALCCLYTVLWEVLCRVTYVQAHLHQLW
jgi:hypothetical protein